MFDTANGRDVIRRDNHIQCSTRSALKMMPCNVLEHRGIDPAPTIIGFRKAATDDWRIGIAELNWQGDIGENGASMDDATVQVSQEQFSCW